MLFVGLVFDDQKVTRKLNHDDFMLKNFNQFFTQNT
jgi:hypothetical protein